MKMKAKQKGVSVSGMLVGAMILIFFTVTIFKLYPAYYDDFSVATVLENMELEGGSLVSLSSSKIRTLINRRLQVSGMQLNEDDVVITKAKGSVTIDVNYEVRTHLYQNIDAVTMFSHSITVSK